MIVLRVVIGVTEVIVVTLVTVVTQRQWQDVRFKRRGAICRSDISEKCDRNDCSEGSNSSDSSDSSDISDISDSPNLLRNFCLFKS